MRFAALALLLACTDPPPPAPVAPRGAAVRNAQAEQLTAEAQAKGWLVAVNYQADYATGEAVVTPAFLALPVETRQAVAANVAAAGMARQDKATFTVRLVDSNGRNAGTYSTVLGKLVE